MRPATPKHRAKRRAKRQVGRSTRMILKKSKRHTFRQKINDDLEGRVTRMILTKTPRPERHEDELAETKIPGARHERCE